MKSANVPCHFVQGSTTRATGRTTDTAGAGWIRIVIPQSRGESTWFCPQHTYGWVSDGYVAPVNTASALADLQQIAQ